MLPPRSVRCIRCGEITQGEVEFFRPLIIAGTIVLIGVAAALAYKYWVMGG